MSKLRHISCTRNSWLSIYEFESYKLISSRSQLNFMSTPNILVVDDEPIICDMLCQVLKRKNYRIDVAQDGKSAIESLNKKQYDLVVTDVYLPDLNGIEILKAAKRIDPETGVIVITAHSSVESAVEAMKVGAYDYLTKDFSLDEIEVTVAKFFKYQELVKENKLLRYELGTRYGIRNIIGNSPEIQRVFETVEMVAPANATVLIEGASGTGKELIAKAIHQCSQRHDKPFIKLNCAAIPEGLMESELFGHEKGAFTGAVRSTKGRFELADGGTLLLDEVSEIKPSLQSKLLRVLQEKEFEKVGNPETVEIDVRIIATTNRDLRTEVAAGTFREDLFYRLNVVPIQLPTLKQRIEDMPLLIDHFIEKYSKENNRSINGIDEEALTQMMNYDWPGNVRELENTIERAIILCRTERLQAKNLFFGSERDAVMPDGNSSSLPSSLTLRQMGKKLILKTLEEQNGNRTWAAEKLGISIRTLRNKLHEYRKDDPDIKIPGDAGSG